MLRHALELALSRADVEAGEEGGEKEGVEEFHHLAGLASTAEDGYARKIAVDLCREAFVDR